MNWRTLACLAALLVMSGCQKTKRPGKRRVTTARVAAVKPAAKTGVVNDKSGFCEKTFPASGPDALTFKWPPLRPLPGETQVAPPPLEGHWSWINLWATWCVPCMDEMPLLGRWAMSLQSEGQKGYGKQLQVMGQQGDSM